MRCKDVLRPIAALLPTEPADHRPVPTATSSSTPPSRAPRRPRRRPAAARVDSRGVAAHRGSRSGRCFRVQTAGRPTDGRRRSRRSDHRRDQRPRAPAASRLERVDAAKRGLGGLIKTAALEFGQYGIACNAVAPGEIATPMTGQTDTDPTQEKRPGVPLGRPCNAREIAHVIAFLASPQASYTVSPGANRNDGPNDSGSDYPAGQALSTPHNGHVDPPDRSECGSAADRTTERTAPLRADPSRVTS